MTREQAEFLCGLLRLVHVPSDFISVEPCADDGGWCVECPEWSRKLGQEVRIKVSTVTGAYSHITNELYQ